ncbi:hypothetical protein [Mycolicibacterium sp.]|uniref:hypothetical protein n=1 Tax=Mycolicibacterium sp. TaxID=2320850 RepID=UPI00355D8024
MIDPRLQDLIDGSASADTNADTDADTEDAPLSDTDADTEAAPIPETSADTEGAPLSDTSTASLDELMKLAAQHDPSMAPIAEAAASEIRIGTDGTITASPALRTAMRALVPGPDSAPAGTSRVIAGWLTDDNTASAPVTETSPYFTVSHWHWLAAQNLVRRIPADLGPTFPHLFGSEAQIIHDLKAWSALDEKGALTSEAAEMFGAVTGHAELTAYGTVLLYAQRREPVKLPAELEEFGLAAAVRNVPRVTFAVGATEREVVSAVVNNSTVVFSRRLRRTDTTADVAAGIVEVLDPDGQWPVYPLTAPIVLPASVTEELATNPDTAGLLDTEPGEDATNEERAADAARRERIRKVARAVLGSARTPAAAAEAIAEIATATTHALAQITVRTSDVDVSRTDPGALAVIFLRDRGVLASYPSGSGQWRRITYTRGNVSGITDGITALRNAYRGG